MSGKSDIAVKKFKDGYNCAQSVIFAFCDVLKLDKDTILKLSTGFGGGIGRMQEVCGAVSGGIMAISTVYGRGEKEEISSTDETYLKVREFIQEFNKFNGSYLCRELLNGCELLTEEGHNFFKKNDMRNKICAPCINNAVEILEKIL